MYITTVVVGSNEKMQQEYGNQVRIVLFFIITDFHLLYIGGLDY